MTKPAVSLFNDRLPNKPYFSDDLHFGVRIAGKERAILAKHIQFNQPHAIFWLSFDVDRAGAAIDWSDCNAHVPTLTITKSENGYAHLLYALETSIRTAPDGKMKPLRYAAAVVNALRKKLDADTWYSGLICKNPNHGHWKIAVWQPELYTLFDKTRKWAYRAIRQVWPEYDQWLQACYERTAAYNLQFPVHLDDNELSGIAKSIAKWTYSNFSEKPFDEFVIKTHSPEIQAIKDRRGGVISKRNADPQSERSTSPWESESISRSTFYRKKFKHL